jgi:uncharacterized membrane protein YhaH (DUF805 family)
VKQLPERKLETSMNQLSLKSRRLGFWWMFSMLEIIGNMTDFVNIQVVLNMPVKEKRMKATKCGFTLVELVVALGFLTGLALVVVLVISLIALI